MSELHRQRVIREKLARMAGASACHPALATGLAALDAVTGGLPRGGIVELFGAPSTGKTTLALQAIAHLQQEGGAAAWIDAEHCFDAGRAAQMGVAVDRLPVAQPAFAEEALEIVARLALSGAVDLLVVDSAAALVPRIEIEAAIGGSGPGTHGRVLASGLRRVAAAVRRSGAVALFLNQTRARGAADPECETAAGGPPLKLFAALRVALRGAPGGGGLIRFRVLKNKGGEAYREGELRRRHDGSFAETP